MIGGILLAAGSSRRYGDDKRKIKLPSGRTVLQESIRTAAGVLTDVMVVIRFGDQAFVEELEPAVGLPNVEYFRAPDSARGMAHSLANAIHEKHEWEAAVVLLGNMPYLKPATIEAVVNAWQTHKEEDPIVFPKHGDKLGHPVVFPRVYFEDIEALEGDVGAKAVIEAHKDKVLTVEVDDPGILLDIDTPDDLLRSA